MKVTYHNIQKELIWFSATAAWADVWKAAGRAVLGRRAKLSWPVAAGGGR